MLPLARCSSVSFGTVGIAAAFCGASVVVAIASAASDGVAPLVGTLAGALPPFCPRGRQLQVGGREVQCPNPGEEFFPVELVDVPFLLILQNQ